MFCICDLVVSRNIVHLNFRVCVSADSTVLAYVLSELNRRHDYGLDLFLLSVDEGITGYRDDSLETVKRNEIQVWYMYEHWQFLQDFKSFLSFYADFRVYVSALQCACTYNN